MASAWQSDYKSGALQTDEEAEGADIVLKSRFIKSHEISRRRKYSRKRGDVLTGDESPCEVQTTPTDKVKSLQTIKHSHTNAHTKR